MPWFSNSSSAPNRGRFGTSDFATIEPSTATATLCLEVARALAAEDRYDVGLIDAYPDSVP